MIPEAHARFVETAIERIREDPRFVGVAAGGSYGTGTMDDFSDVDLVIAVEPAQYASVMEDRESIAREMGPLVASFTGEHVGEPRVLICLYGPPLLHVDLKFISLEDAGTRIEDPVMLWEREGRFTKALTAGAARFPPPDLQWIEDRFWVWVHYGAAKIGRGELFEALDFLSFLRGQVIGPLALESRGARPSGVRKIEWAAPEHAKRMEATVAAYDARSCLASLRSAVGLYLGLRDELADPSLRLHEAAERAAMGYLEEIEARLAGTGPG